MLMLNEVMRLVDASKEGRLTERGKATLFNALIARSFRRQRDAGRNSAAYCEGNRF